MNDKDKEAIVDSQELFEEVMRVIEISTSDILKNIINDISTTEKLQAENAKLEYKNEKLKSCVEFYADLEEEAIGYDIRGVTFARSVLKELEEK